MRQIASVLAVITGVTIFLSGCGGSGGTSSRVANVSEPLRTLPPSVSFAYTGTATVNRSGVNSTVPATGDITIGRPGFIDPRTNTPVLLFNQTFTVKGVESLLYRDFFYSQPGGAVVAEGSEVLGVATFAFAPEMILPPTLTVGQTFGNQTEPYETLTVNMRESRVIRIDRISVAGTVIDAFRVHTLREIPFGVGFSRFFDETNWYAPGIAGPVPLRQRISYSNDGAAVTLDLDIVGIPVFP